MDFYVPCECGHRLDVSVSDAGTTKSCDCGRSVSIPRLSKLRELAGMTAYEICPADEINRAVAVGTWSVCDSCSHCGSGTDSVAHLHGICEEAWRESPSISNSEGRRSLFLARVILAGLFGRLLFRLPIGDDDDGPVREHGRDVNFTAPFRLCDSCQRAAKSKRGARKFAESTPVLQRLLKKYPDATFRLLKAHETVGIIQRDPLFHRA